MDFFPKYTAKSIQKHQKWDYLLAHNEPLWNVFFQHFYHK